MPWASLTDLPEPLRKALEALRPEQKAKWLQVANACLSDGGEEGVCIAAAWTAAREIGMNSVPAAVLNEISVGADGRVPDWIEIARTGTWLGHPQRPETVTPEMLASALAYFERHYAAHGTDLVVDYHHASVAVPLVAKAPAAGWIDRMELRNSGTELWAHVRMWVTEAANSIAQREFRYVSPVLRFGQPDRVTGTAVPLYVASVALTNTPFLTELESLNAANGGAAAGQRAGASHPAAERSRPMRLLESLAAALGKKAEEVASLLGLAQDADDAGCANAIVAFPVRVTDLGTKVTGLEVELAALKAAPKPVICADVANALGVAVDADLTKVSAAILRLKAPSGAGALGVRTALQLAPDADDASVINAIGVLQTSKRRTDAEELVEGAIKAGKVPPAHREFYLREALHDLGAAMVVINSLTPITTPSGLGGKGAAPRRQLTDAEAKVAQQLNLKPEEFAAHLAGGK